MTDRIALARHAARAAIQLRRSLTIPREVPVNAFDIAQMAGLDVRFLDVPSLEGMFIRDPGLRVLLPSLKHRPRSRVLFSCAHEIGHHELGHGTTADEYLADGQSPESSDDEYQANAFAAHLLMPRAAVLSACQRRQGDARHPSPLLIYLVSRELGVGYETLVNHMCYTLEIIDAGKRKALLKTTPKTLVQELTGDRSIKSAVIVDASWKYAPIDAECGDTVMLPGDAGAGCPLLKEVGRKDDATLYMAVRSGRESITVGGDEVSVRVSRQHYVGPYSNRYLPDPDEH